MANRTSAQRFLGVTKTGNLADLKGAAGAAANSTTIFRWGVGALQPTIRAIPLAANGSASTIPAAPSAPSGFGWQETAAPTTEGYIIDPGTWSMSLTMRRSGQALEADYNVVMTAIVYRIPAGTPTGTTGTEITRITFPRTLITTTNKVITASSTTDTTSTMAVNDLLRTEIYCTATDASGVPTAPTVSTDFILQVNASATDSRISAVPNFAITFSRGVTDSAPAADTVARTARVTRSVSDSAPAGDTVTRSYNFPRTVLDSAPASDTVARVVRFSRTASDSAPATDTVARGGRFSRTVTDSAPATDSVSRAIRYVRQVSDNIGPSGGGTTTIIKRPILIFDD